MKVRLAQATLFKMISRQSESGFTFLQLHTAGSQRRFGRHNSDTTITADGVGGGSQWEDLGRAGVVGLL